MTEAHEKAPWLPPRWFVRPVLARPSRRLPGHPRPYRPVASPARPVGHPAPHRPPGAGREAQRNGASSATSRTAPGSGHPRDERLGRGRAGVVAQRPGRPRRLRSTPATGRGRPRVHAAQGGRAGPPVGAVGRRSTSTWTATRLGGPSETAVVVIEPRPVAVTPRLVAGSGGRRHHRPDDPVVAGGRRRRRRRVAARMVWSRWPSTATAGRARAGWRWPTGPGPPCSGSRERGRLLPRDGRRRTA